MKNIRIHYELNKVIYKVIGFSAIVGIIVGVIFSYVVQCSDIDYTKLQNSPFNGVVVRNANNFIDPISINDNFTLLRVYQVTKRKNTTRHMYYNNNNTSIYLFTDTFTGYSRPYCWWLYDGDTEYVDGYCDVNNDGKYESHFSSNKPIDKDYDFSPYWKTGGTYESYRK